MALLRHDGGGKPAHPFTRILKDNIRSNRRLAPSVTSLRKSYAPRHLPRRASLA